MRMSLAPFNILISCDRVNGISKEETIPWSDLDDGSFFQRTTTSDQHKNYLIMGRITFEQLGARPLEGRSTIVVSRTWKQTDHFDIKVASSLMEALSLVTGTGEAFICGGVSLFREAMSCLHLCKKIYLTRYRKDYHCDEMLPRELAQMTENSKISTVAEDQKTGNWTRFRIIPKIEHPESSYIDLLSDIKKNGESMYKSTFVFGRTFRYNLDSGLNSRPTVFMLTTRLIRWTECERVINDLIDEFKLGENLQDFKENPNKLIVPVILLSSDQASQNGAKIADANQLTPFILSVRNTRIQFVGTEGKKVSLRIDLHTIDVFNHLPVLITAWSCILRLVCSIFGFIPDELIVNMGICLINISDLEACSTIIRRVPRPLPWYEISSQLCTLRPLTETDATLEGYSSWKAV